MSCKGKDFGHKHKIKNAETNIWLHALGLQHREQKEELLNKCLPRQRPATALNRAQILQHQKLHKKAHKKKMYVLGKVEAEENLLKYHSMPDITLLPETYQHTILPMFTACCCRAEFRSRQPTGVVALPHWVYWCVPQNGTVAGPAAVVLQQIPAQCEQRQQCLKTDSSAACRHTTHILSTAQQAHKHAS